MRNNFIKAFVVLLIIQPFFSFGVGRVVLAGSSEEFVEVTSSTYVGFWYHIDNPDMLAFDSILTNGEEQRRSVHKDEFFKRNFEVHDASFLRIPDYVTDVNLIEFELVSKPAHVLDPRSARNPDGSTGLIIVDNYKGTGERRLRVPIVSNPYLAQQNGQIYLIEDSDRGRGYRYDTKVVFRYKLPPPEMPEVPDGFCYGGIQPSVTRISGVYYRDGEIRYYYETLSIVEIRGPDPSVVKAGQGSEIVIVTRYTNQNPRHRNQPFAPSSLTFKALNTEDWPNTKLETIEMIPNVDQPEYHWGNGRTVEWRLPYAKFDKDGNWTKHWYRPIIDESKFEYGGFQRWYVGFDVPDNVMIPLSFDAIGGHKHTLQVCDERFLTVKGSPFDDFIIRPVDPNNPFPTGTGLNWQGKEHLIYNLKDWYNEQKLTRAEREEKIQSFKDTIFQRVKEFFTPD